MYSALFIWAFYPETSGRRLEGKRPVAPPSPETDAVLEMDALFEDAPLFVPSSGYEKLQSRHAAEQQLRTGTFVAGELTEKAGAAKDDHQGAAEHYETTDSKSS